MALPVSVVLDRVGYGLGPLDLSPLVQPGSLNWSTVVPGGFASCAFTLDGDPRQLVKQVPYLSLVRVIGDSGRVLFEGQVEDLAPSISETSASLRIGAYGLQNALKEQSVRVIWSKRDLAWNGVPLSTGNSTGFGTTIAPEWQFTKGIGQVNPANLSQVGVFIAGNGSSVVTLTGACIDLIPPASIALVRFMADFTYNGAVLAVAGDGSSSDGAAWSPNTYTTTQAINRALTAGANRLRLTFGNAGATGVIPLTTSGVWLNMRVLGTTVVEDVAGGFFGATLIRDLLARTPALGPGVIEAGSDFTIDHLDASIRRSAYDILQEIALYDAREWAVWENALLDWKTPNLAQPQWLLPIADLSLLDLDASVQNSKRAVALLYTDAASGITSEAAASSVDRRNPYVLNGRTKDAIVDASIAMTALTAGQLATALLNDLGFGPVPAAGTIALPGEKIVQHAQGNAIKAWEIRAGDNVTIPELPLADVFTQDGRGENLFHVISSQADASTGIVTLTLDSYGSKRSDVLLARLAAVTRALGG
jgi:hypothetical protein